jgi:hypothetical protein
MLPDFSTHPDFRPLFDTLVAGGQSREQATLLLTELWHRRVRDNALQAPPHPLPPQEPQQQPQQPPDFRALRNEHADQIEPQPLDQGSPPPELQHRRLPIPHHEEHPAAQLHEPRRGQAPHPVPLGGMPVPQDPPPLPSDNEEWPTQDKADKRGPHLPPIDLDGESLTMSLQRPTTYAIERLPKCEIRPRTTTSRTSPKPATTASPSAQPQPTTRVSTR